MEFFYPNFINDMWRIFGLIFFGDKEHFVDEEAKKFKRDDIIRFLEERGIGLYDTACAVVRTANTAADKDLEVVESTDLDALLSRVPQCEMVIVTGQKAADVFAAHFKITPPKVGFSVPFTFNGRTLSLWRMPSSSRAYPMKVEKKAEMYARALGKLKNQSPLLTSP